jgi:plastocyanin
MKSNFTLALLLAAIILPQSLTAQEAATESKPAAAADQGEWGHLTGAVTVDGDVAAAKEEAVGAHADKAACLVDGKVPLDDNVLVNSENKGLADVYVIMYLKKKKDPAIHPSYEAKKAEPVVLDNVNCRFVPHATFVRTGQKLILKNSDAVGHNCHITTFNNEHNPNIPANSETEVKFDTEDSRPGNVTCDLHKWMDSVIFIRDNPYVAITDADGKFTIENLPAGEWDFQFWHKKVGYLKKLSIENQKVSKKGVTTVTIAAGETADLGTMKLPAKAIK